MTRYGRGRDDSPCLAVTAVNAVRRASWVPGADPVVACRSGRSERCGHPRDALRRCGYGKPGEWPLASLGGAAGWRRRCGQLGDRWSAHLTSGDYARDPPVRAPSIRYSKKRPQQDSNLRTLLRRPLPCIALTSANMVADGPAGRLWGAARQSFGRWRVAAGDSSRPHMPDERTPVFSDWARMV